MEFYRTFIGLPVKVGNVVLQARTEMMQSLSDERISWVDPERYHITLRFIGDTEIATVEKIGHALQKGMVLPEKSFIRLSRTDSFGPKNNPRVIWVGFENNTMFEKLKLRLDNLLLNCEIPIPDQPFRAHLTLGRVRSLKDLNEFYNVVATMKDRFNEAVLIDRLVFYRSELASKGPIYTPLSTMDFKD